MTANKYVFVTTWKNTKGALFYTRL